ncbi:hypothetical protein SLA2020_508320 [Shorea laevis]
MAGGSGDPSALSLEHTPTWALATVCLVFIFISIFLEYSIHLLTNWLKRHRKTALCDAVEKLKSELMLLGFISLLLAVTQSLISNICIPAKFADTMLPCRKQQVQSLTAKAQASIHFIAGNMSMTNHIFRGLEDEDELAPPSDSNTSSDSCSSQGKVSLVTQEGIHQLHIFIFVLAVMQIVYSVLTMALGRVKMRRWKAWEKETQTTEYLAANDPDRFRFTRQTTFGRRHVNSCTETSVQLWIKCFFRQFFHSVAKVDYLTLRHGFISAHMSGMYTKFNFQKYIQRSLDEDFKVVVSISPLMWLLLVIFLLVDVHGWHIYLWMSFVPLLVVLVLGTKLQVIVTRMAIQINNQNNVIRGTPLVQPNDKLFWFGKPRFVLTLLHFTLFMNAFELAFFIWVTIQFGVDSCYHEHTAITVTRIVLAVTVQVLCSYRTLPLYALVTQMGSEFKGRAIEKEHIAKIIKLWHAGVRERRKKQEQFLQSPRISLSPDWSSRRGNRGGTTEEQDKTMKEEAAASSSAPLQPVKIELPVLRKE